MEGMRDGIEKGTTYHREAAAYSVATIIGMQDMVPMTIEREVDGEVGSLQKWVANSTVAFSASDPYDGRKGLARAAAFDYLMGNTDRHEGNWMVSTKGKLVLIDHGLSLSTVSGGVSSYLIARAQWSAVSIPREVASWDEGKIRTTLESHKIEPEAIDNAMERLKELKSNVGSRYTWIQLV